MLQLNNAIELCVHLQLIINAGHYGQSRKQINAVVNVAC